jgi:hypothetical protein
MDLQPHVYFNSVHVDAQLVLITKAATPIFVAE